MSSPTNYDNLANQPSSPISLRPRGRSISEQMEEERRQRWARNAASPTGRPLFRPGVSQFFGAFFKRGDQKN